jgi:hypothetical protein
VAQREAVEGETDGASEGEQVAEVDGREIGQEIRDCAKAGRLLVGVSG